MFINLICNEVYYYDNYYYYFFFIINIIFKDILNFIDTKYQNISIKIL